MPEVPIIVRTATTFSPTGELDEEAFRQYLQRFVDQRIGVYLASGGSGEGCALTWEELRRVYEIGVEVCKGRVFVGSNQPDQHTAQASLEHARLAIAAGVETVQLYGPAAWHGYRVNPAEYRRYFDRILPELHHPVALSPNPLVGYSSPALIADICNSYPQIVAVNLTGREEMLRIGVSYDNYVIELRAALTRDLEIHVSWIDSLHTLGLGAVALHVALANVIPKTFRRYADLLAAQEFEELHRVYADLTRVSEFVSQWRATSPRMYKMAMKVFKLPGGEGGVREPHLMLDDTQIARFTAGMLALDVPEINEMALAAGLA